MTKRLKAGFAAAGLLTAGIAGAAAAQAYLDPQIAYSYVCTKTPPKPLSSDTTRTGAAWCLATTCMRSGCSSTPPIMTPLRCMSAPGAVPICRLIGDLARPISPFAPVEQSAGALRFNQSSLPQTRLRDAVSHIPTDSQLRRSGRYGEGVNH